MRGVAEVVADVEATVIAIATDDVIRARRVRVVPLASSSLSSVVALAEAVDVVVMLLLPKRLRSAGRSYA